MRRTKAQQEQTRAQIIRCAVELVSRDGYDDVTMKDIARAANIGDATIYKYFPSKDRLILGYFDLITQEAVNATLTTQGIDEYDLQSRLQRLTDAILERLLPDRKFAGIARSLVLKSPFMMLSEKMHARQLINDVVLADLEKAVADGEIPDSDFLQLLSGLYVDYCFGIVTYWLGDTSAEQADTTHFVDQTLGILVVTLKSGLPDRLVQLGLFILRSQFARLMPVSESMQPDEEHANQKSSNKNGLVKKSSKKISTKKISTKKKSTKNKSTKKKTTRPETQKQKPARKVAKKKLLKGIQRS